MVYFLYCLVHALKLSKNIKYIFPIRGHTYLQNDQDFSLIRNEKKKITAEVPDDWNDIMETSVKTGNEDPYVQVRYYSTGPWHRIQIRNKRKLPEELQFQPTYNSRLPLNPHKYNDILKLTHYLSGPVCHNFYADLLGSVTTSEATTSLANEVDNEDNSSGTENN
ncbi:unnamed protein product [Euphydryas editha]|uniref:Uncharacterized protein n=1 Tax=Euphydryas editha TaxID=104508 RepID=A0AAU9TUF2_EUPED|nr:unnamed protein product [Euphydryas editha]